jgi:predicted amidophosphoribosyltransferase
MALRVISFATYLTNVDVVWRGEDYDALKFVKAIKGKPINKYAYVPVGKAKRLLEERNADDAIAWFGEMAIAPTRNLRIPRPLIFVPIPNSSCTSTNGKVPRTTRLAKALLVQSGEGEVWDRLRWKAVMTPSSQGGTRDPQELYDNLVVAKEPPKGSLVLVDDVRTTGAHLRAAAARLVEKGARVPLAVCAARTVLNQDQEPFSILEEQLEDFKPRKK